MNHMNSKQNHPATKTDFFCPILLAFKKVLANPRENLKPMRKLIAAVTAVSMMGITPAMAAEILWDQETYPYAAIEYQQLESQQKTIADWQEHEEIVAAAAGVQVPGESTAVEPVV